MATDIGQVRKEELSFDLDSGLLQMRSCLKKILTLVLLIFLTITVILCCFLISIIYQLFSYYWRFCHVMYYCVITVTVSLAGSPSHLLRWPSVSLLGIMCGFSVIMSPVIASSLCSRLFVMHWSCIVSQGDIFSDCWNTWFSLVNILELESHLNEFFSNEINEFVSAFFFWN